MAHEVWGKKVQTDVGGLRGLLWLGYGTEEAVGRPRGSINPRVRREGSRGFMHPPLILVSAYRLKEGR